jgi:hypothetical protein
MSDKLIQKHFLHGKQTFEIRDDFIRVKITSLLRGSKELDVELAMLNPEPVIDASMLHFHSRVKCGPLLSLYLNKPNQKDFNAFVDTIKSKARKEYEAFAGLSTPRA